MIGALHESLRSMLFGEGKIPASDVDVTFATPSRDWLAGINRPTINFYLHGITENAQFRESDFEMRRQNMDVSRRLRPRRVDLKYLITVHFKSQVNEIDEQEWKVLWRVLAVLMRNTTWPETLLPEEARELSVGIQAQVAQAEPNMRQTDLFSGLGIPPSPALSYVLTAPIDLNIELHSTMAIGLSVSFQDMQGNEMLAVQRYAWKFINEAGDPVPGVEVRLPSAPGFSVSGLDGLFTTRVPHAEVRQLLIRRPAQEEWEVLKVKKGTVDIVLPGVALPSQPDQK